jgi:hypothetical protein
MASSSWPPAASVGPGSAASGPPVSPAPASPARTAACRPPPGAGCWSGAAPRPPGATGGSGPSRPRRGQGRAAGPASTHERAAALDAVVGKGWEPDWQANGRGRWVQGPAGQRSGEAVVRPARAVIDDEAAGREAGPKLQPPGVAATSRGRLLGPGSSLRRGCGVGWPHPEGTQAGVVHGEDRQVRPQAAPPPARLSHGAPAPGGQPGQASGGSWAVAASAASGRRRAGGRGRRWDPSRVARGGRSG